MFHYKEVLICFYGENNENGQLHQTIFHTQPVHRNKKSVVLQSHCAPVSNTECVYIVENRYIIIKYVFIDMDLFGKMLLLFGFLCYNDYTDMVLKLKLFLLILFCLFIVFIDRDFVYF